MALTENEQLQIVKITGVSQSTLATQLRYLGSAVSETVETAVRDEIVRWETFGAKFTRIHPMEANFGAEINPEDAKSDIRRNLINLLYLDNYWVSSSQTRLVRS